MACPLVLQGGHNQSINQIAEKCKIYLCLPVRQEIPYESSSKTFVLANADYSAVSTNHRYLVQQ